MHNKNLHLNYKLKSFKSYLYNDIYRGFIFEIRKFFKDSQQSCDFITQLQNITNMNPVFYY